MKVKREWTEEPELFDEVVAAMDTIDRRFEESDESALSIHASDERGDYGERGFIRMMMRNGRTFQIELSEIL